MSGGPYNRPAPRRKTGGAHDDRWAKGKARRTRMRARQRESTCAYCGERPVQPAIDGDACDVCYRDGATFG